ARTRCAAGSRKRSRAWRADLTKSATRPSAGGRRRAGRCGTGSCTASRTPPSTSATRSSHAIFTSPEGQAYEGQGRGGRHRGLWPRRPRSASLAAAPTALALSPASLGDGRRALLSRHLVAAIAPDALRVRGDRSKRDAEL